MKQLLVLILFLLPIVTVSAELFPDRFQKVFSFPRERLSVATEGSENAASRLEITGKGILPFNCSKNNYTSGYAHFTNGKTKKEDKHMFWWFFEALNDPINAPVILTFGGGPGTSGTVTPFLGPGPCKILVGDDNEPYVVPSEYAWTSDVNLIAIDHPVGTGYSYGDTLRNSSAAAALDVDDFLQKFWKKFPHLAKNKFVINSGSYGGTYIPHIINALHMRNNDQNLMVGRVRKMADAIMMSNVWSDTETMFRWYHKSNCGIEVDSNPFLNLTACSDIVSILPKCLDALQLAYEQPELEYKMEVMESCFSIQAKIVDPTVGRNAYDFRKKCPENGCDALSSLIPVQKFMNSSEIGVPRDLEYKMISEEIAELFVLNGDMVQPSYKLLAPAVEEGLRVMVYNGLADGVAPWRPSLAWMKLLKTKHQRSFRASKETKYSLSYSVQQTGSGEAGEYTFVKVWDAGHFIVGDRSDLVKHLMLRWVHNKSLNITGDELV